MSERALILPFTPLLELDGIVMLRDMEQLIAACDRPSWPTAAEIAVSLTQERDRARHGAFAKIQRPLSGILISSLDRAMQIHYRVLAQRRMAAVALAIRLCEVDHGRRPTELAELVPDYLDEVPADPMAADGATFRYLPDAAMPVLYSVGEDSVDDGGLVWDEKRKKYDRYNHDVVFLLDGRLPDPQP